MKRIKIFDTTLRDGEQSPGCSMTIKDKVEIAKILDEMGVDTIEAGFASSNEKDMNAIKEISKVVKNSEVVSLARCNKQDIDYAYEAIKDAKKKKIHTFIATSEVHMKDKLKKTREEVKEIVKECVSYAKSKVENIEFSLEDATRTDKDFACEIINIAVESGATVINIPDTVGCMEQDGFRDFINYLKENSRLSDVEISVHCHNDFGMATANSLAALKCGIDQIECTINGIGERAGNTALEEVVAAIKVKKEAYDSYTNIDTTKIKMISDKVVEATHSFIQKNKAIVGENAFKHEAGIHQAGVIKNKQTYEFIDSKDFGIDTDNIVIGIHSGKAAIIDKIGKMNKNVEDYEIDKIMFMVKRFFERFTNMTDEQFIKIIEANRFKTYEK